MRISKQRIYHRLRQFLGAIYLFAILGCVGIVGGAAINDHTISQNPGRALAEVNSVSILRTIVTYQDDAGKVHIPYRGVLYPTGLGVGQRVWVVYSRDNPDLVKVEGRTWTLSLIPALSSGVVITLIFAVGWWSIGRTTRGD